jgi:ankyrin repeat protein
MFSFFKSIDPSERLAEAVRYGDLDGARKAVADGANVNAVDQFGDTALHKVVRSGSLELVQYLVAQGADLKARGDYGGTVLHQAARSGSLELVQYLVAQGADVKAASRSGNTVLHQAARGENLELVQYLVAQGADVKAVDRFGETALHGAAMERSLEVVQYLVAQGVDVNARDRDGKTALQWAALSGSLEAVQGLVAQGADVNAVDRFGKTALQWAKGGLHFGETKKIITLVEAIQHLEKSKEPTVCALGKYLGRDLSQIGPREMICVLENVDCKNKEDKKAVEAFISVVEAVYPGIRDLGHLRATSKGLYSDVGCFLNGDQGLNKVYSPEPPPVGCFVGIFQVFSRVFSCSKSRVASEAVSETEPSAALCLQSDLPPSSVRLDGLPQDVTGLICEFLVGIPPLDKPVVNVSASNEKEALVKAEHSAACVAVNDTVGEAHSRSSSYVDALRAAAGIGDETSIGVI